MKIGFYNLTAGYKTGGLETFTWEMARAVAGLGHEVHIIGGSGGAGRHPEVTLTTFPYTPREKFPNFGTRFRKMAERLSFARTAWRHVLAGGFDALVINKPYDFPLVWWLRRQGYRGVVAYNSGGVEFYAGDRAFAKAIDIWIPCSDYNARQMVGHFGCQPTVIYNGVDPAVFAAERRDATLRDRYDIPPTAPLIASTGRLVGWKGLAVVINALPGVPDAHYLVIGDGEDRNHLEQLARERGVAERVHFHGEVRHAQLPPLVAAADIYVQPSVGEEAFGISVVEAMSCGLPVCASRQGGLVEVVADGETGWLLPPGDAAAWRDALIRLAAAPELRARLGAAGRARVLDCFTWANGARRLVELVEARRPPRAYCPS